MTQSGSFRNLKLTQNRTLWIGNSGRCRRLPVAGGRCGRLLGCGLLCGVLLAATAGCQEFGKDLPLPPGGNGNPVTSDPGSPTTGGAGTQPPGDAGNPPPAGEGNSPPVNPPPASPPAQPEIAASANSIRTAPGGVRNDPELLAPPSDVNLITWKDSRGADRTMTLGAYLYEYDYSFDDNQQVISRRANDNAWGHPGFGYVVSHSNNGNSPLGKQNAPTRVETRVLNGGHHAIHRVELLYDRDKEGGGNGIKIPVVIEWLVATGRDHPVWSVTWKPGEAVNPGNVNFDTYRMDVRGPYGSLNFDGVATRNQGDAIGGVAWGDAGYKFTTTDGQLTLNSPWTYNTANTVAFTQAWTANVNAEMGIIQTRVSDKEMGNPDRVLGRERGGTSADMFTNRGDCAGFGDIRKYLVPCVNGWPYQMMNYDWDPASGKPIGDASGTKLMAWGTPYGWLGASSFESFDSPASKGDGRGDRSYGTFVVLGPKSRYNPQSGAWDQDGDVATTVKTVEALAAATISDVTAGSLVTQLPKGPGASQMKTVVQGYNDTYAAYYLRASDSQASFTFTPAADRPVKNPIFVVQNYKARQTPKISVAGAAVTVNTGAADAGAFASINTTADELWVTMNRTLSGASVIQIIP